MLHPIYNLKTLALAAMLALSATTEAASIQFDVFAAANSSSGGSGLNTGLNYNMGEIISGSVDVNDLWSAGQLPRWSNADGLVSDLFATGSDESGQVAGTQIGQAFINWNQNGFSAPFGALVGKINNQYLLLGTSFSIAAPDSGTLLLYYWDSNSLDNTDFITVSLDSSSAVPLPATAWLMISGLLGMMAGIRKKVTV